MDDTRTRIIRAAMAAVRRYGLEGVRIQNVSEFAGITPGAIYRHFESKEQLLTECFTFVDKQAAEIFEHLKWDSAGLPPPHTSRTSPSMSGCGATTASDRSASAAGTSS